MLSIRATKTNAWFLDQYSRALSRQGSKKTSNVDLATAENWLIRPEIMKLLRGKCCLDLEPKHLSYASGLGGQPELLSSLATFYNSFFEPYTPVKLDHLVVGPGCSAIIDTLIHDICDSGDGLLVAKPMWGSFQISAVVRNNVKIIPVHITLEESKSAQAVVAAYRSASQSAASRIRGILFCNPHNPSGHIARPEVIDLLLQYCEEADIHFISDEIYALSTFETPDDLLNASRKIFQSPAKSFVSVLHRDLGGLGVCPSRVHQVYSISKDLGCSGLRLGCLVTQANKELRLSQSILNNAKTSNVLGVMFTPIFNDTSKLQALFKINRDRLRDAAHVIVRFAEFHGLEYYKPAAGLYIWIRLSPKCNSWTEEENSVRSCAGHGVLIGSGADYADSSPGWFRVTFAVPRADLLTGLQRIEEALNYVGKFQNASAKKSDFDWWRWLEAPTTWGWSRV